MLEIIVCFFLPWAVALGVAQGAIVGSAGIPLAMRVPLGIAGLAVAAGIVFGGLWGSYTFFPDGVMRSKTAEADLAALSADFFDVRTELPDEYERLLAAVRNYPHALTHEAAETFVPPASMAVRRLQQVASNADDDLLLDVWRKSLTFDRELAATAVDRCAYRSIGHMLLPRPREKAITEAEMEYWRARRNALDAGRLTRRPAITEQEGIDAMLSFADEMTTEELQMAFEPPRDADPVRVCALRIRFAEAAANAPKGPTAIRFVYQRAYQ